MLKMYSVTVYVRYSVKLFLERRTAFIWACANIFSGATFYSESVLGFE